MTDPLVSVVLPNRNYSRYIAEAIESVLTQTYEPVEIVVVDNGSTDDSLAVISSYADRVSWISESRQGQSIARNSGIARAQGDFVAFLDADDVWLPNKLEKQMSLIKGKSDVGLVYCGIVVAGPKLEPLHEVHPTFGGQVLSAFATNAGRAVILGGESTAVVRRSVLDRVGPFDERLSIGAGWDLWRRVSCHTEVAFAEESLVLYRQHDSNAHSHLLTYVSDMELAALKMFQDPAAGSIHHLKNRHMRNLEWLALKSLLRGKQMREAGRYALKMIAGRGRPATP